MASHRQNYKVTCDPKVAPGVQPVHLTAEVRVEQASLAIIPQTNMLGKCAVQLKGTIVTNLAHADVVLAYKNHKGVTTPSREVTTGANRQAQFTDTLDFGKSGTGLWIDQSGVMDPAGGEQAGTYAGSFQIVGASQAFQSNVTPYSLKCTSLAPGGLAPAPPKAKPAFPPVGPLTAQPRDPEPSGPGTAVKPGTGQGTAMAVTRRSTSRCSRSGSSRPRRESA